MKAIWKTNPQDTWPNWTDIAKAGCDRIYFPMLKEVFENGQLIGFEINDRECNPAHRSDVGSQHFQYAEYRDPHWNRILKDSQGQWHSLGGIQQADDLIDAVDMDLKRVGTTLINCPYMLDIEFPYRDPVWLLKVFKGVRGLYPRGPLSWTMEPGQGGWIGKNSAQARALVNWINRDVNFVVVPQTFGGNMEPYGWLATRADMKSTGIAMNRIKLFYDAQMPRPTGWDGCLFHAERLVVS